MKGLWWTILFSWVSMVGLAWGEEKAPEPDQPLLTPAPKQVRWTSEKLQLQESPTILVRSPEHAQVGRVLAEEMERLYRLRPKVVLAGQGASTEAEKTKGTIELVQIDTPEGKRRLEPLAGWAQWPPPRNPEEGYLLCVDREKACVLATRPRGFLYGCLTLVQLIRPNSGEALPRACTSEGEEVFVSADQGAGGSESSPAVPGAWVPGVWICDWPYLRFRGVHLCIFPNTELPAIRQAILWSARFKCNAVVIEPWASLKSRKRPETAYEHTYSPEQIRTLVLLGQALQMDMIPMLNSWGHASGMRSRSGEHVVLDRFPEFRPLYEGDGWSFRLSNPAIYDHLFDRYGELLELFRPVRYFHVGMDEAWGHLGAVKLELPPGKQPHELTAEHLLKLHRYFADRKIQILMWHDMLIRRGDPEVGGAGPAGSFPPYNTHLALDKLPRDIIIAAWNYDVASKWAIPKYFRDKGFPVVVCPWKSRSNTIFLVNLAKELDLLGVLATTWDSLDVSLPSVAQAAVLAWEEPKANLLRIPFDHWLAEIRKLPICNLPHLEKTLQPLGP